MNRVFTSYFIHEAFTKQVYRTAVVANEDNGSRLTYEDISYYPYSTSDRDIASDSLEWATLVTDCHDGLLEYSGFPDVVIQKVVNRHNVQPKLIESSLNEAVKELKQPVRAGLGLGLLEA